MGNKKLKLVTFLLIAVMFLCLTFSAWWTACLMFPTANMFAKSIVAIIAYVVIGAIFAAIIGGIGGCYLKFKYGSEH